MNVSRSVDPVLLFVAHIDHKYDAIRYFLLHLPHVAHHISSKYDLPLQGLASFVHILSINLLHLVASHHIHLERPRVVRQDVLDRVGVKLFLHLHLFLSSWRGKSLLNCFGVCLVVPWGVVVIAFLLDALHFDVLVGSGRSVGVCLVLGNRLLGGSHLLLRWPDNFMLGWPENFLLGSPDFLLGGPDLSIVAILDIDNLSPGGSGDRFLVLGSLALKQQKVVSIGGRLGLLQLVVPDDLVGVRFGVVIGDDPIDDLMALLVGLLVVSNDPVDDLVGFLLAGCPAPVAVVVVVDIVGVPDLLVLKQVAIELSPDVILVLLSEQIEVSLVDLVVVVGVVILN